LSKSNGITLKVEGLKEIELGMKQFAADVQLKILASAVRESAKPMVIAAKENLQVRENPSSGALAESIGIKKVSKRFSGGSVTYLVAPIETNKTAAAQYASFYGRGGSGIYHGHLVEYGVPSLGIKAQPFLRPAADSTAGISTQVFKTKLARGVVLAAKRAARLGKK